MYTDKGCHGRFGVYGDETAPIDCNDNGPLGKDSAGRWLCAAPYVRLYKRYSKTACKENKTYRRNPNKLDSVQIKGGCRGEFIVGAKKVKCDKEAPSDWVTCDVTS